MEELPLGTADKKDLELLMITLLKAELVSYFRERKVSRAIALEVMQGLCADIMEEFLKDAETN